MAIQVKDTDNIAQTVYTKDETDGAISAAVTDKVTQTQLDNAVAGKADTNDVYTKEQADDRYPLKGDLDTKLTETDADTKYASKEELALEVQERISHDNQISEQVAEWIRNHNAASDGSGESCCGVRTRIIYKNADNDEVTFIAHGEVTQTVELDDKTTVTWVDEEGTAHVDILDGVVIVLHREKSCGEDNYLELQNLPTITWTDADGAEHKESIRGDITTLIKKVADSDKIDSYTQLKDKPKVKYNNLLGVTVEKEIPALPAVLDLTDIGVGEKKSLITYVTEDGETVETSLEGKVIEYHYREDTKDTLLVYEDQEGEQHDIVYPGDVTDVRYGYEIATGTSNYRMLEHLPTITWVDEETGDNVTHVLMGDVTDDITELLKHVASGSEIWYIDPDTGDQVELKGDIGEWLEKVTEALEDAIIEDLWENTPPHP